MQILCRSTLISIGRVGSALPRMCRWQWSPALARRDAPLMSSASAHPKQHLDPLSRFFYKPWRTHLLIRSVCATTKCMGTNTKNMKKEATKENNPAVDEVYFPIVLSNSSHRDGAIYKDKGIQEEFFDCDLADHTETRLEPMQFSKATKKCFPDAENCVYHFSSQIVQFFSVLLSKSPISNGPIQLYGYIAARDEKDGMRNYIVNYSRDDPKIVEQGSLIEMTGPKRGIKLDNVVLIEFDMRIKNEEQEDQQLIDGAIPCYNHIVPWKPVKNRIMGNCGAVDISYAVIEPGVEATVEVVISEVLNGSSLSLSSFVDVMDNNYEEILLFHGIIEQSGPLRRFVVAVNWDTEMLLKFKVANDVGCASQLEKFRSKLHGCASRQMKLKLASISVKVTWSTI